MIPRSLNEICEDIRENWPKVYFGAVPYLEAMEESGLRCLVLGLDDTTTPYYDDSIQSVVAYFLSNATTWRGDVARQTKAELRKKYGIK